MANLYERLGGIYAIAAVVDDFIDRVMDDPRLNANPKVDEAHHRVSRAGFKYLVTEMVGWATGGPQKYTGKTMLDSHAHLDITDGEWVAFLDDLDQTFNQFQVPAAERAELLAIVDSTKAEIVLKTPKPASSLTTSDARVLFRPASAEQRFLPEGPYPCGERRFSWVAIQHGATAPTGSFNIFDLASGTNRRFDLPGRPGFAFPTNRPDEFVIGLERSVRLFNTRTGDWTDVCGPVDASVAGTIINDGTLFADGLIFGCKDLKFAEKKAGLYLWRYSDRKLIQLRSDQICSNGKKVVTLDDQLTLLDIDSPTKSLVAYPLDVAGGKLGEPRLVLDFTSGPIFPDGMILTPDGRGVIISFYDPRDVAFGETRQYRLADATLEAVWRTPQSPRATCPQLIRDGSQIKLVITTAVEHMSPEEAAKQPNAGCLFVGDTNFTSPPDQPVFRV